MKAYARADRVGVLIQRALSDILKKEIKDPRLKMSCVTEVKLSRDLKYARIFFSAPEGEKNQRDASAGFAQAKGFIKKKLAEELELRYMPEIRFEYDTSFDYGAHIDKLLKAIRAEDGPDHRSSQGE